MNGSRTAAEEWVEANVKRLGEDADSMTLMNLARSENRDDVMELLITKRDVNGETYAHMVSYVGDVEEMARLKVEKNIDVNIKNSVGDMPINIAAGCGHIALVDWLLENGAGVDAKGKDGCTPIYRAALNGQLEMIKHLGIKHKANLYLRNDADLSPLEGAVSSNNIESIKCLAKDLGMKVDARHESGTTAMFMAALDGKVDCIACLADLGAAVNARDNNGCTPIFLASFRGHTDAIRYLAKRGADVNAADVNGGTPIFIAAMSGQTAAIDCLTELGANVNAVSGNGMTPMFSAAAEGQVASMKCLKAHGAKLGVKDKNGKTAADLALHTGHPEAAEWLRANKEKPWVFAAVFIVLGAIAAVLALYLLPQLNRDSGPAQLETAQQAEPGGAAGAEMESGKTADSRDDRKLSKETKQNTKNAGQGVSEAKKEPGEFTDSRDGQKYRAVKIGNNTWMGRNLNYQPQAGGSWCYNNSNSGCLKYGRLYDWNTAMSACPAGWHLPTRQEWNNLSAAAGGNVAASALKTSGGWIENGNGANSHGFSALPGGSRDIDGNFKNAGNRGLWWSAAEYDRDSSYYRRMGYNYDYVYEGTYGKRHGFSVRCVKDNN